MLATVSLLRDALLEGDWDADPAGALATHKDAIQRLRRLGRLELVSQAHLDDLREVMELLPERARSVWQSALVDLHPPVPLAPAPAGDCIDECLEVADVVAVDRASVDRLPEAADGRAEVRAGREVVRLDCLSASSRLGEVERLQGLDVAEGETRDRVWRQRIEPLALSAAQAVLVDAHAAASVRRGSTGGIGWLFQRLAGIARPLKRFELVLAAPARDEDELVAAVRALAAQDPPAKRLQLVVVAESRFIAESHSRHLRFSAPAPSSRQWALYLDRGIADLDAVTSGRSWPCWLGDPVAAKKREEALRAGSTSIAI